MKEICFRQDYFIVFVILVVCLLLYFLTLKRSDHTGGSLAKRPDGVGLDCVKNIEHLYNSIMNRLDRTRSDDYDRLINPLSPPLRRPVELLPFDTPKYLISTPTRGEYGQFQQYGILIHPTDSKQIIPLFSRRIHSNQYEYYTTSHHNPHIKIPIYINNDKELTNGDSIDVPGYNDKFTVKLYNLDYPR